MEAERSKIDRRRRRRVWLLVLVGMTASVLIGYWREGGFDDWLSGADSKNLVPVIGPPRTDFCPELPAGLNFGDPPWVVMNKMGRQPDLTRDISDSSNCMQYRTSGYLGFQAEFIEFTFIDDLLERVHLIYSYVIKDYDDQEAFKNAWADLAVSLRLTFGESIEVPDDEGLEVGSTITDAWNLERNLIMFMYDFDEKGIIDKGFIVVTVSFVPLSETRPHKNIPPEAMTDSEGFEVCMLRADGETTASLACISEEYGRQELRLEQVYDDLMKTQSPQQAERLVNASRAWSEYHEAYQIFIRSRDHDTMGTSHQIWFALRYLRGLEAFIYHLERAARGGYKVDASQLSLDGQKCLSGAVGDRNGTVKCLAAEHEDITRRLAEGRRRLLEILPDERRPAFESFHQAWLDYHQAYEQFLNNLPDPEATIKKQDWLRQSALGQSDKIRMELVDF